MNSEYKLLNNSNVPEQAKNGIMGKSKENNSTYNWDIKAGVYNAYVKEAQLMLMNMGYKLPKYGVDGKWSNSRETYEALLGFQKGCETQLRGVKKNGIPENRKEVEHFQSIEPTGKLVKEYDLPEYLVAGVAYAEVGGALILGLNSPFLSLGMLI